MEIRLHEFSFSLILLSMIVFIFFDFIIQISNVSNVWFCRIFPLLL